MRWDSGSTPQANMDSCGQSLRLSGPGSGPKLARYAQEKYRGSAISRPEPASFPLDSSSVICEHAKPVPSDDFPLSPTPCKLPPICPGLSTVDTPRSARLLFWLLCPLYFDQSEKTLSLSNTLRMFLRTPKCPMELEGKQCLSAEVAGAYPPVL